MRYLLLYLLTVNALGFTLMLVDKYKAKKGLWRIPEATLMTAAFIGGSFGAYLGMQLFRHKTKHLKFSVGIPVFLALHIVALCWMIPKL